jgi:bacterioferritin (cytochrome b1)
MAVNKGWSAWWREFLGHSPDGTRKALEILSQRYVEASQQVARFTHHAERMHYPHFRDRLLAIAAEKAKHVEAIAEKIKLLGGRLPDVPPPTITEKTSWQYLSEDLNEEQQRSVELIEQARTVRAELPAVAEVLERIYEDSRRHRETLREMLMRSDPQSHLSYLA